MEWFISMDLGESDVEPHSYRILKVDTDIDANTDITQVI